MIPDSDLIAGDLAEELWQHRPLGGGGHLQLRHEALCGARHQVQWGENEL